MQNFLSENSYMIVSALILLLTTMYGRMIIKIFRLGVTFNSELATKKELNEYKLELRAELREYKTEITNVVLTAAMSAINEKLKEFNEFKKIYEKSVLEQQRIELKANDIIERYEELKAMNETVRGLMNKVQELQFGIPGSTNVGSVRRSI